MADTSSDILMRVLLTPGQNGYLPAECQTEVTTDEDSFVEDYYNGQFFEVKEFDFGLKIEDTDKAKDAVNPGSGHPDAPPPPTGGGINAAALQAARAKLNSVPDKQGPFARWKSATPEQIDAMPPYMPEMQEFSVTRLYDKASPVLFEKCCNSVSLDSISLVKRKQIGTNMLRGFLRMDFREVLVTHIQWDNAEVMKETFRFVFRHVKVKYRRIIPKENADPELREMSLKEWSYDAALKASTAK